MKSITLASATTALSLALAGIANAETMASATTDLNIRSGPGPQHDVIGVIGGGEEATVLGCLDASRWCQVSHDGIDGWAYSDYLTAAFEGTQDVVVLTERPPEAVPVVTYEITETPQVSTTTTTTTATTAESEADDGEGGALAGAATGAVAGALIGGPVGAAIGGVAGAVTGGAADDAIDPPPEVVTYVQEHTVEPVYLEGEVVVGAGLPETVQLVEIPDYDYRYVYVNGLPVLVSPETRRIGYIVR